MPWARARLEAHPRGRVVLATTVALVGLATVAGAGVANPGEGSGRVLAFGANNAGQLGNPTGIGPVLDPMGPASANPTPALVSLPDQMGPATLIASGIDHSLVATASGQLYAFGSNQSGQLGRTANSGTSAPDPTPAPVFLPGRSGPVTHIAAGYAHSLVATSSGQLYAFGANFFGELGRATNTASDTPNPTPALVDLPGQVGAVTQVAAGFSHSLAMTSSGQLYSFGYNGTGELGRTSNGTSDPAAAVVVLPGQVGAVTQIAAGGNHSLAVTASGQLYAFGSNQFGQLGVLVNSDMLVPNAAPALVTLPGQVGPVTQIAAGGNHSLAVTASGQLYAFGSNEFGQLGTPATSSTLSNPVPALVTLEGQAGAIVQVAAGYAHSLVVTASGQVYAFGNNNYGQLGSTLGNGIGTGLPTPAEIGLPAGLTIDAAAEGPTAYHSLLLARDVAIATASLPPAQAGSPYSTALQPAGGGAPLRWSAQGLPADLTIDAATGAISGIPRATGTFSATVTVSDLYGSRADRTFALTVSARAALAPPRTLAKPPRLTAVTQSAARWLRGTSLAHLVGTGTPAGGKDRRPVGTTFSFTVDRAARVTLAFRHAAEGRRIAGRCVATRAGHSRGPRCTRVVGNGTLRIAAHRGRNHLRFEGRVSRSTGLGPGSYSVVVSASGAVGRGSAAKTLHFTVMAPRPRGGAAARRSEPPRRARSRS
jgi:alpha-tubulin suppressor-like RCC1 family protein